MTEKIVVVGSVNADVTVGVDRHPAPGETVRGYELTTSPGGKGANQALAAARMGGDVTFVGAVGSDDNANLALGYLKEAGVNLDYVAQRGSVTGIALIAVDSRGENNIIVVGGANDEVDRAVVDAATDVLDKANVVVVQGEIPVDSIAHVAELTSARLVVNLAPVVNVSPDVLRKANPLVVNEYEAGLTIDLLRDAGATSAENSGSYAELAQKLRDAGVPSVVMTIGGDGALVSEGEGDVVHVPSPQVEVVDTTGAGDAFVGGLATRLAKGDSLLDAARFAVRVGASACTGAGAQSSYPRSLDELPVG